MVVQRRLRRAGGGEFSSARDPEVSGTRHWPEKPVRDNRIPETRGAALGALYRCWCGEPMGHGWPGRDSGEPHPRTTPS